MKTTKKLKISAIIALLALCGTSFAQIQTFPWQGTNREYLIKTPQELDKPVPVLFFLHGLGDNITRIDNEYNFQQIAEDFGWVILVPQALPQSGFSMWNAGMMSSNIDDSGFLMALVDSLAEPYHINLDSVFFTGFSMGGFMSHRMAIEHGDRIAGCAPVSGLITFAMSELTPVAPVRMLHIHGTSDNVVNYDGTSQVFGGTLGLSVEAILDYWQNANGCEGDPEIDSLPDTHNDGLRFIRYTYGSGTDLEHIKVVGGTHTWYHSDAQYDASYMNLIHEFFTRKAFDDGVTENPKNHLSIWPNPTKGEFNIEVEATTFIEVMDVLGRMVIRREIRPGTTRLDLSGMPEGIYFVKGENGPVAKLVVSK
ncbi:MAG: T9SS type A sorting domain-containing protein [Bacteroidales bacterium]|nr:T9SS type A sorting domain-containing protein [Bacteroidales bacterium]